MPSGNDIEAVLKKVRRDIAEFESLPAIDKVRWPVQFRGAKEYMEYIEQWLYDRRTKT